MTTEQIMALADAYATAIAQQGEAHDHIARDKLQSAVEELEAQLAEANKMQSMLASVNKQLRARLAEIEKQEPVYWAVFDEDGDPMHITFSRQMAHDHINDAFDYDGRYIEEACKWVARPVYLHPSPAQTEAEKCRGYALLGTGNYCIDHTPDFDKELGAEILITLATDADRSNNRQIGEARDNPPNAPPIQPNEMVIRIGFLNERGLFALEDQLRMLREIHFPVAAPALTDAEISNSWNAVHPLLHPETTIEHAFYLGYRHGAVRGKV